MSDFVLYFNVTAGAVSAVVHGWLAALLFLQRARRRIIVLMAVYAVALLVFAAGYATIVARPEMAGFVSANVFRYDIGVIFVVSAATSLSLYRYYRSDLVERAINAEREATIAHMVARQRDREQAAERFRRDVITNVSHELRTPLTIIMGQMQLIFQGTFGDVPEHLTFPLTSVDNNTRRMNIIVRRLVMLMRDPYHEPFILADVARATLSHDDLWLATRKEPGSVSVEFTAGDAAVVHGDVDMVQAAIFELLHNAIKFMPAAAENPQVAMRVWRDGTNAVLTVSDNGAGIDQQHHRKIFDVFYQIRMDIARPHEGAGVGLALVRDVAEKHGGRVDVESAPGKGAAFHLRLPLREGRHD